MITFLMSKGPEGIANGSHPGSLVQARTRNGGDLALLGLPVPRDWYLPSFYRDDQNEKGPKPCVLGLLGLIARREKIRTFDPLLPKQK